MKDDLIKRQLNESDSLHAVQKMDFQSKLREISNKYKLPSNSSTSSSQSTHSNGILALSHIQLNDQHVPIVHVNNKFDIFDAALNAVSDSMLTNSSTTNANNSVSISIYS